ncbi:MAG: hypothetical protein QOC82_1587 [Frankiaceae bacterium]|nr:hypothetical protein [Frankiaceae bacterium]
MSQSTVSERSWERYGAATGVAFGVLLLVAIFAAPQPPHIDASAQKIAAYYADHRHAVLTAGVFGAFATVAAVLFIAHLRHVYDRVENGIEGLSTVIYASGIAAVGASVFYAITSTTLAFMAAQPGGLGDAGIVRAMYDVGYIGNGFTFLMSAVFLAANAVGMVRGEVANPALGWFAALVGAASTVAAIGSFTVSSYSAAWSTIGLVSILGLAAWDITAGSLMLRHPEAEAVATHRSLIVPAH